MNILEDGKYIVLLIIESICYCIDFYNMKKEDFVGIGMGILGSVDIEKGIVVGVYNLNWMIV